MGFVRLNADVRHWIIAVRQVHEVRAIVRTIATRMEGSRISRLDILLTEKQERSGGWRFALLESGKSKVLEVKRRAHHLRQR